MISTTKTWRVLILSLGFNCMEVRSNEVMDVCTELDKSLTVTETKSSPDQ